MFFKCKVCAEKDARIQDLRSEISNLRKLVLPSGPANNFPMVNLEANAVLNPQSEAIEVSLTDLEVESEATRLLVGNYDNVL